MGDPVIMRNGEAVSVTDVPPVLKGALVMHLEYVTRDGERKLQIYDVLATPDQLFAFFNPWATILRKSEDVLFEMLTKVAEAEHGLRGTG